MQQQNSLDPVISAPGPAVSAFDTEHPVIQLPFSAMVDGRLYEGDGISLVGATAHGLVSPQLEGEHRLVTLVFPFSGFNVALPVEAAIDTASASGKLVLRFTSPAGPHLPQLRHLLNSFISGEITDIKSVLATSASALGGASAKPSGSRSASRTASALLKGLLITVASVALFGFVGVKAYERLLVIHPEGISVISQESMALRSVNAGQLEFIDLTASEGQAAYAIRTVSGDLVSVAMPCNCTVLPGALANGATVRAGETVMNVAAADAPIEVPVRVGMDGYRALAGRTPAQITLADGTIIAATLKSQAVTTAAADSIDVVLQPQAQIDPALVGTPVSVTIDRTNFGGLMDTVRRLVSGQGATQ